MVGGLVFTPSLLVALLVVWLLLTAAAAAEERRETLPDDCGTSVRRPWRDLSCHEQRQFLRTLSALKENGLYDEFVMVHWSSRLHSHDIPDFLPWHRWFLWVFEKELQRESGTCMTIPYWDWETDDNGVLKSWSFGSEDRGGLCVRDGIARHWNPVEPTMDCVWRDFDDTWEIYRENDLLSLIRTYRDYDRFAKQLESGPHDNLHQWIGGHMADNYSPDDPLFWVHHSNVDRIWTLWQDYHNHDKIRDQRHFREKQFSGPHMDKPLRIEESDRIQLNVPHTDRRPTPRELLTNLDGLVSVQYAQDALAGMLLDSSQTFQHRHNPHWISAVTGTVAFQCRSDFSKDDLESFFEEENGWRRE